MSSVHTVCTVVWFTTCHSVHLLEFASEAKPEYKRIYDTANFYHFVHTLALLGVPLSRRPRLVRIDVDAEL